MIISNDELYDFYAHLGQALYAVQTVEGVLHKLLAIRMHFIKQRPSKEEADKILEGYRSKTLGALIRVTSENSILPTALVSALEQLNADRRLIVHRLQEETDDHLRANPVFRRDIVHRLGNVASTAFELNKLLGYHLISTDPSMLEKPEFKVELEKQLRQKGFI